MDSNENITEDDAVLIEEESDIDPTVETGIKPTEDKEDEKSYEEKTADTNDKPEEQKK